MISRRCPNAETKPDLTDERSGGTRSGVGSILRAFNQPRRGVSGVYVEDLPDERSQRCWEGVVPPARQLADAVGACLAGSMLPIVRCRKKLRQLAAYPKEAERLPEILAYYGIRFVVVEPLPGAKMDGAAFWIGLRVIAVSARWDRIDAFWFTVMHEFMHIKNHDGYSWDANLVTEGDHGIAIRVSGDVAEQRANDQAANALVPRKVGTRFIHQAEHLRSMGPRASFSSRTVCSTPRHHSRSAATPWRTSV